MSATSSFLRRPAAGTTTASIAVMATGVASPSNGNVAGDLRRQPVGCSDRGALRLQHLDGVLDGAVVQRRMGRARDQDKDVFHGLVNRSFAIRGQAGHFARHGAARHRHHRPDGQRQVGAGACARRAASRHGDQCRCHADLRRLPDPDGAADGATERSRVPHALYGVLPLSETLSAARWRALADVEIERCLAEGRMPILCGGSGLYLADADAGHRDHPRCAGRPARPGQCRLGVAGRARRSAHALPRRIRRSSRG